MKRIHIFLMFISLAFLSCTRQMEEFQVVGDPYFSIKILGDSDVPEAELDEMSARYTLQMEADGYSKAANAGNHILKAKRFHITSNLRWKIVPADAENVADWVKPFPETGEKDGIFFFKTDRNVDPDKSRESYFNILVDKGTGTYEPLEGLLHVVQAESPDFLEMNAAKLDATYTAQTVQLRVSSNVPWTYELTPTSDYGTSDLDWLVDETAHTVDQQNDTLRIKLSQNTAGIRGATITLTYSLDGIERSDIIPITQYPEVEATLEGFPVKWAVRVSDNTFADTFPSSGAIAPVSGNGMIRFVNECGKALDASGTIKLDVSDNSPRVTGAFEGDYCEFVAHSPISAGSIVKLVFATRSSAKGPKYWRLEYRDGDVWKVAGGLKAAQDLNGKQIDYTHSMIDANTNTLVESVVKYENTTDQVEFRFICASTLSNDETKMYSAPGGGTWRLSVDSKAADDPYQPSISVVSAGGEIPQQANLSVTPGYLYFESNTTTAKTFHVTSDQDITVKPEQSWIHVDKTQEYLGENIAIAVTCDANTGSKGREGKVTVISGISRKEIAIIQGPSGSGQPEEPELEPFMEVSTSEVNVNSEAGYSQIRVMTDAAVAPTATPQAEWLSVSLLSSEKDEATNIYTYTYKITFTQNDATDAPRSAKVGFTSADKSAEVTVTQAKAIAAGTTIYFEDDFSWLQPFVDAHKKAKPTDAATLDPIPLNIASHAQPNIWSTYSETVGKAFTDKGYVDLNPSAKTLYMQECYFKMGAGNKQTGITLPVINFEGDTPVDVELSFNWCAHKSGSGNIDDIKVVVSLENSGVCADTNAAKSNEFTTTQQQDQLVWQSATIILRGVTKDTRISIKPNLDDLNTSGNHRWHLDNILILKTNN